MKILSILPLTLVLVACFVPDEQPTEPISALGVEVAAVCSPYQACDTQSPACSCPSGFLCAAGLCVRDDNPWTECYSTADCITTSPPYANTCWKPKCNFYVGPTGNESGCGWEPEAAGTACKKENGQNGQCGSGDHEAECI